VQGLQMQQAQVMQPQMQQPQAMAMQQPGMQGAAATALLLLSCSGTVAVRAVQCNSGVAAPAEFGFAAALHALLGWCMLYQPQPLPGAV
jgi:DNA-binding protein YbaB